MSGALSSSIKSVGEEDENTVSWARGGAVGVSTSFVAGDLKPVPTGGAAPAPLPSSSSSSSSSGGLGEGVYRTDEELVELLSRPPKTVPALRTKSSFQDFFRGMRAGRMQALLERSCAGLADATEAEKALKVKKRMELLHEVLVDGN